MNDFKEVLYEALLYSFGKVLAGYNTFAQDSILKDIGKEIIEYLNKNGFEFSESNSIDDVSKLINLFVENGFANLEVLPSDKGENFKWGNLYGIRAYAQLQEITDNPFLSCPLNACLYYIAEKHGKTLKLHSKSFDLETSSAYSQEEIVDANTETVEGFNSLIIENRRLLDIYEKKNTELEKALSEIKTLRSFLPICSKCKKIRDKKGYWNQLEKYIENHTDTKFSHGLCEECADELYKDKDWYKKNK